VKVCGRGGSCAFCGDWPVTRLLLSSYSVSRVSLCFLFFVPTSPRQATQTVVTGSSYLVCSSTSLFSTPDPSHVSTNSFVTFERHTLTLVILLCFFLLLTLGGCRCVASFVRSLRLPPLFSCGGWWNLASCLSEQHRSPFLPVLSGWVFLFFFRLYFC
jgi:hypothetical protein